MTEQKGTAIRVMPAGLRCDAPGCLEEFCIRHNGEQFCFTHAVERGNRERLAKGLPPVVVDDEGLLHVRQ